MLSAKEIRNVKFSKSMSGYKQEEVDILLDKVESDYEQFERTLREMAAKIEQLKAELEESKSSQGSIESVLISAQKLADQIVEEAKTKSAQIVANAESSISDITTKEQELIAAFDNKASIRKAELEEDVEKIIAAAEARQQIIEKATQDSIDRQKALFDKMKIEVAAFKADITAKYKEHIEILSKLPDSVPTDPAEIAAAVSAATEKVPPVREFIENKPQVEETVKSEEFIEQITAEFEEEQAEEGFGFVINTDEAE